MKVHFIAIGGSIMNNLAIALRIKGISVTGSDDDIYGPAYNNLKNNDLLPDKMGWDADRITPDLDAVILGMHARMDNPELKKARDLMLKIYSFPEYVYEQTQSKKRVVIGGSHGKTTITAMIMHVLNHYNYDFDYLVGAKLDGFDLMVRLTEASSIVILEGDEYLSSALEPTPKFHFYHPHIAVVSGIAWDHINVFPDFDEYVKQFEIFVSLIEREGVMIYNEEDQLVKKLTKHAGKEVTLVPYKTLAYKVDQDQTYLKIKEGDIKLKVFGEHNLQNMSAALQVCLQLGISEEDFYSSIRNFAGAANRLERIARGDNFSIYKDFAHSPSKLKATIAALKNQYPSRTLVACLELHTFSSLNKNFLQEYEGTMDGADICNILYNPESIRNKKLEDVTVEDIHEAFKNKDLNIFTDSNALLSKLQNLDWDNANLLMMTSGNFDGMNFDELPNFVRN